MALTRLGPAVLSLALAAGAAGCGTVRVPEFARLEVIPPDPHEVDAVLFLIGDAGEGLPERSPVLRTLGWAIESWSEALARDSAVTVLFLGDNAYPVGVRERDHAAFSEDSLHLWSQIELLAGPAARRRGAVGVFLAGNHDWGNMQGLDGLRRLRNLEEQLDGARAQGLSVDLVPEAGEPGPVALDIHHNVRLLVMDTHWFLQEPSPEAKDRFFAVFERALEDAEGRHVILAAHHPFASAGEHGVIFPVGDALGLVWLLKKTGTLIQDLNTPVYADFLHRLRRAIAASGRPPLAFAGGHDHSLQVMELGESVDAPGWVVVSGAGSKLTRISHIPGLEYGATGLGYMMLVFRRDDAVELYVMASESPRFLCPEEPEPERVRCMDEESAAFRLEYSAELAPPSSLPRPETAARGSARPRACSAGAAVTE